MRWINPKTFARVRDACRAKLQKPASRSNVQGAKRELAKIETKLEQAKRRLLEVDVDMVQVVQDHIRELTTRGESLKDSLRASDRPQDAIADIDIQLDNAMKWFERLQEACKTANPVLVRNFLTEAIERIDLTTNRTPWTAKRFKYSLAGGMIYLNSGKLSESAHERSAR